jgi:hypothetical protein
VQASQARPPAADSALAVVSGRAVCGCALGHFRSSRHRKSTDRPRHYRRQSTRSVLHALYARPRWCDGLEHLCVFSEPISAACSRTQGRSHGWNGCAFSLDARSDCAPPDLPLCGNRWKLGLGLWIYLWPSFLVEMAVLWGGVWMLWSGAAYKTRLAGFAAALSLLQYVGTSFSRHLPVVAQKP